MRPAPELEDLLPPHKRARVSAGDTAKLDFIVEAVANRRSGFEQPAVLAPTVDAAVRWMAATPADQVALIFERPLR